MLDQLYILERVLSLLDDLRHEQHEIIDYAGRAQDDHTATLENILKLYPMIVQGISHEEEALLQLPHINAQNVAALHEVRLSLILLSAHK